MTIEKDVEHFMVEAERSVNQRDWDGYGQLFSEDLVLRAPGVPGEAIGRDARVKFVQGILKTFPDGRIEGVRAFGQGSWGCVQFRFKGTNTGPLATPDGGEAPATNKSVGFPYCVVARFEDGMIAELDEYFDQLDMLTQLGLAP